MKLLVCGTQKSPHFRLEYKAIVYKYLTNFITSSDEIIEGCCKNSADEFAEDYAEDHNIKINHYPSGSGHHLKRNIEMVEKSDFVYAFWDNFSYGTAHTVAHAVKKGIPIRIIDLNSEFL